jgi:sugar diacid utilization regulator
MPTVAELLDAPTLRELRCVAGLPDGRQVRSVTLIPEVERLAHAPAGSFAILAGPQLTGETDYRLDMVLRLAGAREVAAVALALDESGRVPTTAALIAERAGLAIVRLPAAADLGALCAALGQEIAGGATAAIARAERALEALLEVGDTSPPELMVERAGTALGVKLRLRTTPGQGDLHASVLVDGAVERHVCAPADAPTGEVVTRLVLQLVAEMAGRSISLARRRSDAPARSRAQLLAELLLAAPEKAAEVAGRVRSLGLPVDGWHQVVRLEAVNLDSASSGDEIAALEITEQAERLARQVVRSGGTVWHSARVESALLLVRMDPVDPGPAGALATREAAARAIERVRRRYPALAIRCGVGSPHQGAGGLRASAAEARSAAAAARARGRTNVPVTFDAVGLRRMLLEWYASDVAQESVRSLLEPLDRLGPQRTRVALQTLRVYLDQQGSLTRSAKVLHLHRNAVAYRIKRIFDLLGVDSQDPDQLLALQIACRARSLS